MTFPRALQLSVLALLIPGSAFLRAAPPVLDALYPAGAQTGTETTVTVVGKFEPWPANLWCSNPKVKIQALEKKGQFKIVVPKEFDQETVLLRLHNAEGVSLPRHFQIGKAAEINEQNGDYRRDFGQLIEKLPSTVNGRLLARGEVDFYEVVLKKGRAFHAVLDSYSIGAPIDPHLLLYDSRSTIVARGNDNPLNLDPRLSYKAEKEGHYVLAIMGYQSPPKAEVAFTGNSKCVYRLHLRNGQLPSAQPPEEIAPKPEAGHWSPPFSKVVSPSDSPFRFEAKKGEAVEIRVEGRELGSPIDPVLTVHDPSGKLIKEIDDDKGSMDASYRLVPKVDGIHELKVTDRFRRTGSDIFFRLAIKKPEPHFKSTTATGAWIVSDEKPIDLKIKVDRHSGHKAKLHLRFEGLPKHVKVEPEKPEVSEKGGEVSFKFKVEKDAPAWSGPFQIMVRTEESGKPKDQPTIFSLQTDNSRGRYLIDETTDLWLTTKSTAKPKKKTEEPAKDSAKAE